MDPIGAMRIAAAGGILPGSPLESGRINPAELKSIADISTPQPGEVRGTGSFSDVLGRMVQEVNSKQADARAAVGSLLAGQNVPLHQVMIATEEASVSFQLMVEVRNKLLESYQELMRMQI